MKNLSIEFKTGDTLLDVYRNDKVIFFFSTFEDRGDVEVEIPLEIVAEETLEEELLEEGTYDYTLLEDYTFSFKEEYILS